MKKFFQKKLKNEKGMTLIELLAVIVIIAIIAAIAIPAIGNLIQNSRNGAVKSDYQNALNAANIYFTENTSAPSVTVAVLAGTGAGATTSYLEDQGSLLDTVLITKNTGGNTIAGDASNDDDAAAEYTIVTDANGGLTNSEIGAYTNAQFTGTAIDGTP